jgi:outer membrane protein OmpA-like peptidoglycan-associated protein
MANAERSCAWLLGAALALWAAADLSAAPALGQKMKMDGIITHRAGTEMTVKTEAHGSVVVLLTDQTEVGASKFRLGLLKEPTAATALIPGLRVNAQGIGDDEGRLVATSVRFTTGDLETAQTMQAALTETKEQLAETDAKVATNTKDIATLNRRFDDLGEYDVKAEATLYFPVGSAVIDTEGAAELQRVSATAKGLKGYLVGVEGYADASGGAVVNQKLSLERSQAVVNWLAQQGGIPFVRMLAPGAMSTAAPVASNETAQGRAQNRRVVVRVMVNRGLAGS